MTEPPSTPPADLGLLSRAMGVLFSPTATFRAVLARPRSVGIVFLVCVVLGLSSGLPLLSKTVQQSFVEAQMTAATRGNEPPPPATRQMFENIAPYAGYIAMGQMFIVVPVITLLTAGLYWLLFNVILGGTADYKYVLAIVAHSNVVFALGVLLAAPIILMNGIGSQAGPFHLGGLVSALDPTSPIARLFNGLTVFGIWQTIVTAIGLGLLYRRTTFGVAVPLMIIYVGITAFFFVLLPSLF
jgi:hypothetical protein